MMKKITLFSITIFGLIGCATTGPADKDATLANAVTSPLEVLNLRKQTAPLYLQQAGYLYQASPRPSCEMIAEELSNLNEAIGELDADDLALQQTSTQQSSNAATNMIGSASASIIPLSGVVRVMSGAKAAQQRYAAYYDRGRRRRSFLKGYALGIGCLSPISPKTLTGPRR